MGEVVVLPPVVLLRLDYNHIGAPGVEKLSVGLAQNNVGMCFRKEIFVRRGTEISKGTARHNHPLQKISQVFPSSILAKIIKKPFFKRKSHPKKTPGNPWSLPPILCDRAGRWEAAREHIDVHRVRDGTISP